jgi:putative isomerase
MYPTIKKLLPACYVALIFATSLCAAGRATAAPPDEYVDLLNMHGAPSSPTDRTFNIFFDEGAWQGYSLPRTTSASTGFVGPFVHSLHDGRWTGVRFAEVTVRRPGASRPIVLTQRASYAAPGHLVRRFAAPGLEVEQTLFFANSWTALVRVELSSTYRRPIAVEVRGKIERAVAARLVKDSGGVVRTFAGTHSKLITRVEAAGSPRRQVVLTNAGYQIAFAKPIQLEPGHTRVVWVEQTLLYDARTANPTPVDLATAWRSSRTRWADYLKVARSAHLKGLPNATARRVVVKAIETLLGNWRAPRGDLHHAGVVPSYSNRAFNGFWAWDSWKHAAALAWFAPKLAKDQMLAMFDYQAADGMIPDCVFLDKANDNWRDTKPPLATWAALEIYRATRDKSFLAKLYPKLVRYHDWWYAERDHDHNGLAEYGSTDSTKVAAKWESGMDNAVRFDYIRMLKNSSHAWSMNQEAVDLNADLYREDIGLRKIAGILGKPSAAAKWDAAAAVLKAKISAHFFNTEAGYFFDTELGTGAFVKTYGSDGWIPLWAGAATPKQAEAVVKVIADRRKFATYMPFPTLAADDPHFLPAKGYWRGPVWLDQAYFGVAGLRRYGFDREADVQALRLIRHAHGLTHQGTIRENYDPLTGKGYQSRNFSWAAASYILLLLHRK